MGWRAVVASALLVAEILVAGCTGTRDAAPLEDSFIDEEQVGGARVSDALGAIEGVAVDESLAPLANVTVRLLLTRSDAGPPLEFLTTDDGAFWFELLAPGTYQLSGESSAFSTRTQFVQINAAEVTKSTLQMTLMPSVEPYVDLYVREGLIECDVSVVVTSFPCPRADGTFALSLMMFDVPDGFAVIVFETAWRGFSDSMRVDLDINDEQAFGSTQWPMALYTGRSPLRYDLIPGTTFVPPATGQNAALAPPRPVPTQAFPLASIVQWLGSYQEEINSTMQPACAQHPVGYCQGAGAALELRYTNYVSVFVHAAPPDVSRYTSVPDS